MTQMTPSHTQTICRAQGCTLGAGCAYWYADVAAIRVAYINPQHTGEHCVHYDQRPRVWGSGGESHELD